MSVTSVMSSGSAFTSATRASTLSSSTAHVDWGSKWCTFFLSIRESSWELFPLWLNSLVQRILIICYDGILLERLWSCYDLNLDLHLDTLLISSGCSLEGPEHFCILRLILDLSEAFYIISLLLVTGRVVLMLVWRHFVDARKILLLIMLICQSNSTVSCSNF